MTQDLLAHLAALFAQVGQGLRALPLEYLATAMGDMERLRVDCLTRLLAGRDGIPVVPEDRLLTAKEAAEKLRMKVSYLYQNSKRLPFTVHLTPRQVRFSLRGIEKYIRQRTGQ